jgi:hypothetical protein
LEKNNPSRLLTVEEKQNYARISIMGQGQERKLLVEFMGLKGEKIAEWNVSLKEISNKK